MLEQVAKEQGDQRVSLSVKAAQPQCQLTFDDRQTADRVPSEPKLMVGIGSRAARRQHLNQSTNAVQGLLEPRGAGHRGDLSRQASQLLEKERRGAQVSSFCHGRQQLMSKVSVHRLCSPGGVFNRVREECGHQLVAGGRCTRYRAHRSLDGRVHGRLSLQNECRRSAREVLDPHNHHRGSSMNEPTASLAARPRQAVARVSLRVSVRSFRERYLPGLTKARLFIQSDRALAAGREVLIDLRVEGSPPVGLRGLVDRCEGVEKGFLVALLTDQTSTARALADLLAIRGPDQQHLTVDVLEGERRVLREALRHLSAEKALALAEARAERTRSSIVEGLLGGELEAARRKSAQLKQELEQLRERVEDECMRSAALEQALRRLVARQPALTLPPRPAAPLKHGTRVAEAAERLPTPQNEAPT